MQDGNNVTALSMRVTELQEQYDRRITSLSRAFSELGRLRSEILAFQQEHTDQLSHGNSKPLAALEREAELIDQLATCQENGKPYSQAKLSQELEKLKYTDETYVGIMRASGILQARLDYLQEKAEDLRRNIHANEAAIGFMGAELPVLLGILQAGRHEISGYTANIPELPDIQETGTLAEGL